MSHGRSLLFLRAVTDSVREDACALSFKHEPSGSEQMADVLQFKAHQCPRALVLGQWRPRLC